MDCRPDSRPDRTHGDRHRGEQRARPDHGPGARARGRARGARLPQHREGRRRRSARSRRRRQTAKVELEALDLGSPSRCGPSPSKFAAGTRASTCCQQRRCDGASAPGDRRRLRAPDSVRTILGHFALTGLLLGKMEGRDDARVVTLTSGAHRMGHIAFDDLQSRAAATSAGARTASRSSPTCCSRWSSTGGCERAARGSRASPPTPATPQRTCRRPPRRSSTG